MIADFETECSASLTSQRLLSCSKCTCVVVMWWTKMRECD